MKKRVRITETDLKNTIKSILNELDWKTYANAAKKRLKQYNDTRDVDKFNKFYDLNKYANERFDDDFVGLMKYDTLGDSWRGKKSAKFDSRFDVGTKDRMPYGAVKGRNKSGDDIFSTEKGVYHSSKGITKPSTFFKDKEVADAYEKANDELWDYDLGNYEYQKGKGWVNKNELSESKVRRIVNESVKRVLKEGKFLPDSVTYAKTDGMKHFQAIDLSDGVFVGNIIYATCIDNTPENQEKLQRLADNNKEIGLVLQLRQNNKIVFQTN